VAKAEAEFAKFRQAQSALPAPVDEHFDQAIQELERIEEQAKPLPEKPKRARRKKKKEN
jgi:hypothetical protein